MILSQGDTQLVLAAVGHLITKYVKDISRWEARGRPATGTKPHRLRRLRSIRSMLERHVKAGHDYTKVYFADGEGI